jgi:hypothetical protein
VGEVEKHFKHDTELASMKVKECQKAFKKIISKLNTIQNNFKNLDFEGKEYNGENFADTCIDVEQELKELDKIPNIFREALHNVPSILTDDSRNFRLSSYSFQYFTQRNVDFSDEEKEAFKNFLDYEFDMYIDSKEMSISEKWNPKVFLDDE